MKRGYGPFFLLSLVVFVVDQATKYLVTSRFALFEAVNILPFFSIVYVRNTGSAFGMFKSLGNVFFIAAAAIAIAVVAVLIVRNREGRFGLSLILGGAAGNMADRLVHGYVVDFLDFYAGSRHWPAFNVADSALTVGIGLLLIGSFFHGSSQRAR
jgi:signal peptidase II